MRVSLSEQFIAYLALVSGLCISSVAVYYSVIGLTSIFAAAFIPIVVMGVTLEVSKLVATIWIKQNWHIAPRAIKVYLLSAIIILMLITSMGIFGYLSKAHMDQNLVSGDVSAKISIFDEKIKIAKENIDANRKALKQLDDAVDQVMGRSTTEAGADKAVAIRRSQQKERGRLLAEIETEQKKISDLNEEAAPIRAEVRKVEAEVGPIKYIANFVYSQTEQAALEKAVTWVIMIIVMVFDPLAVVLLLASQISFENFRRIREQSVKANTVPEEVKIQDPKPIENPNIEPVVEHLPETIPQIKSIPEPEKQEVEEVPKTIKELPGQFIMRTKVFRRPPSSEVKNLEPAIEKPKDSDTAQISSDDYMKAAQLKHDTEINLYAELVRTKQIELVNVPDHLQSIVKTKI